jgi:hypothetical protein
MGWSLPSTGYPHEFRDSSLALDRLAYNSSHGL